jgi:hypothetical protein
VQKIKNKDSVRIGNNSISSTSWVFWRGKIPLVMKSATNSYVWISKHYRVIHNSFRNFRHLRYSSRDGHAEREHVNRGRDTPSFCHTLQVLDTSTLGDTADVNPVMKFLPQQMSIL